MKKVKEKSKNINWHDGKLWAGLISLLIVLVQAKVHHYEQVTT